jgi:two-component system NtrC family sensor kinase
VDLGLFIPEVTGMIANKAAVNGIDITLNVAEDTPPVHGDAGQLQQVLLNLFNNAMDAVYEKHGVQGGRLNVTSGADGDGMVWVSVADNGCGIGAEDRKKIFSPFYTTKPVGKGTGLGLSVCYGIVNAMGGTMEVNSEKGIGTTFTIRLPAA